MERKPRITIRMPAWLLKAWLRNLRSGKLRQAKGTMLDSKGAMCCLGVLQYSTTGSRRAIERTPGTTEAEGVPTLEWLEANGITFNKEDYNGRFIAKWKSPSLPSAPRAANDATELNDEVGRNGRHTFGFKAIADFIEAHAEGY